MELTNNPMRGSNSGAADIEQTDDTDSEEDVGNIWEKRQTQGGSVVFEHERDVLKRDPNEVMREGEELTDVMRHGENEEEEEEEPDETPVRISDVYAEEPKRQKGDVERAAGAPRAGRRGTMFPQSEAPVADLPFSTDENAEALCFTKFPTYNASEFFGASKVERVGVGCMRL